LNCSGPQGRGTVLTFLSQRQVGTVHVVRFGLNTASMAPKLLAFRLPFCALALLVAGTCFLVAPMAMELGEGYMSDEEAPLGETSTTPEAHAIPDAAPMPQETQKGFVVKPETTRERCVSALSPAYHWARTMVGWTDDRRKVLGEQVTPLTFLSMCTGMFTEGIAAEVLPWNKKRPYQKHSLRPPFSYVLILHTPSTSCFLLRPKFRVLFR
jgi:hypothetical protein